MHQQDSAVRSSVNEESPLNNVSKAFPSTIINQCKIQSRLRLSLLLLFRIEAGLFFFPLGLIVRVFNFSGMYCPAETIKS